MRCWVTGSCGEAGRRAAGREWEGVGSGKRLGEQGGVETGEGREQERGLRAFLSALARKGN